MNAQESAQTDAGGSWATPTGVESRDTFTAYVAPSISDPPTQAEVQAIADAFEAHSQHLVALINDLIDRGGLKGP
ncbi:hypothetical protein [Rhizorhabdus wittichii]|uniref:hypothetical protein n=1 Tax=Rhizorhabdus wittichii TaxID=160791 RepID=UPI00178C1BEA|nr:hypothetical protein [Rhizorhabdus wittichii]